LGKFFEFLPDTLSLQAKLDPQIPEYSRRGSQQDSENTYTKTASPFS